MTESGIPIEAPRVRAPLWKGLAGGFALALAAALPYLGVLNAPFVFDDVKLVEQNELLRLEGREAFERILRSFDIGSRAYDAEEVRENYRPLRFLSYWIDYRLSKAAFGDFPPERVPPFFFHLQNLLWHVANTLLVFAIARGLSGSAFAGAAAGLLFGLHPIATEAVTYVSGRRDVLSTFFYLAAVALHLHADRRGPYRLGAIVALPCLYALGFLAKEMVVTLPPLLLVADLVRRVRWDARRIAAHALLWGVMAVSVVLTLANPGLRGEGQSEPFLFKVLTASRYTARYLGLLLLPVSQSVDYSYAAISPTEGLFSPPTTLPSALLVCFLLGVAGWASKARRPVPALGILWFLGGLVPVLQFVPIAEPFAERFAYLPSCGLFITAAWGLDLLKKRERAAALGVAGAAACVLFALAAARNRDWTSPLRLWESAVRAQPRAARAHLGYANALKEAARYEEAEREYRKALEIWAGHPAPTALERGWALQARTLRAGVLSLLGQDDRARLEEAASEFERILSERDTDGTPIRESPRHALIHFELAGVYYRLGRPEDALREYEEVVKVGAAPDLRARALYYMGKIRLAGGEFEEGLELLERAARTLPAGDRGRVRVRLEIADRLIDARKELERAWRLTEEALGENPTREEKAGILLRRARLLDLQGELDREAEILRRALEVDPRSVAALFTLADLEARRGRQEEARRLYTEVLRFDPAHEGAIKGLRRLAFGERVEEEHPRDEERAAGEILAGIARKAETHVERGELTAAAELYRKLFDAASKARRPDFEVRALVGGAGVKDKLRLFEEARKDLERALGIDPHAASALKALADLELRRFGNRKRARELYERALQAEEARDDPHVLVNLASLLRAENPARALELYERARRSAAAELLGDRAPVLDLAIGELAAALGHRARALEALQAFLEATAGKGSWASERARAHAILRALGEKGNGGLGREAQGGRDAGGAATRGGGEEEFGAKAVEGASERGEP